MRPPGLTPVNQRSIKMKMGRAVHASSNALKKLYVGSSGQNSNPGEKETSPPTHYQPYTKGDLSNRNVEKNVSFILKKAGFGRG